MLIIFSVLLLIIGFILLIKGADWLVDGASGLAKSFGISDLVIGLTIVSFGTSAPELIVSLLSAFSHSTDLAVGNVIGSNICNILLILGITSVIYPLTVKKGTVWKEIPLMLVATLAVAFLLNDVLIDRSSFSTLSRTDGLTLLLFFAIFLYYTYGISRVSGSNKEEESVKKLSTAKATLFIFVGLTSLAIGGNLIVDNATRIALTFGLSQALIGLTIVAVGTSLPELATSVIAALKKNADIAVGNVVGSNIFNILFVLAVTSSIYPIPFNKSMNLDVSVMLFSSLLLFIAMFVGKKRKLERWQGALFILLYISYTGILIWRG